MRAAIMAVPSSPAPRRRMRFWVGVGAVDVVVVVILCSGREWGVLQDLGGR